MVGWDLTLFGVGAGESEGVGVMLIGYGKDKVGMVGLSQRIDGSGRGEEISGVGVTVGVGELVGVGGCPSGRLAI